MLLKNQQFIHYIKEPKIVVCIASITASIQLVTMKTPLIWLERKLIWSQIDTYQIRANKRNLLLQQSRSKYCQNLENTWRAITSHFKISFTHHLKPIYYTLNYAHISINCVNNYQTHLVIMKQDTLPHKHKIISMLHGLCKKNRVQSVDPTLKKGWPMNMIGTKCELVTSFNIETYFGTVSWKKRKFSNGTAGYSFYECSKISVNLQLQIILQLQTYSYTSILSHH